MPPTGRFDHTTLDSLPSRRTLPPHPQVAARSPQLRTSQPAAAPVERPLITPAVKAAAHVDELINMLRCEPGDLAARVMRCDYDGAAQNRNIGARKIR